MFRIIARGCAVVLLFHAIAAAQPAGPPSPPAPTLPADWINALEWRSIGPANMSGRITAITVHDKDPNLWWAATASGGLLKTTNNGMTFEHQFDREATVSIGDVQVAPSNAAIVWVGTGEGNPRNSASWGDGVYKSADGGKSWTNMGLAKSYQIGRIAIHPQNPDIVYVGALGRLWGTNDERGLYKTTDGGKNWERILFVDDKTGVMDIQMHPTNPDTLLVVTYERQRDNSDQNDPVKKYGPGSGIHRTVDGGKTFTRLTQGLPTGNLGRIGVEYYRKSPDVVYAVVESEKTGREPDDSPYMGINAENAEVGARLTQVVEKGPAAMAGLKTNDIVIAVSGKNVVTYDQFLREIRQHAAGDTVKLVVARDRKPVECDVVLAKRPAPNRPRGDDGPEADVAPSGPFSIGLGGQSPNMQDQQGKAGHDFGGLYRSDDGGEHWTRINSLNPRPMYFSQVRVDPNDNQLVWVLGIPLYRSKNGGQEFTSDGGHGTHADHHAMWIDPRDGRHIILGNDGGIYVSYDRGETWDHLNHVAIGQFYHVAIGSNRDYSVYGGLQDNGTWGGPNRVRHGSGPLNTDWLSIGGGDGFVCQVDPTDPEQIYLESQNGGMMRLNLRTGERGGISPRPQPGQRFRFNWKTPFVISHHNPQIHYSAGNYVFRSVKKGESLQVISPRITKSEKGAATAIAESPLDENVLYVGTTDGAIWATRDGGKNWTDLFPAAAEEKKPEQPPAPPDTSSSAPVDERPPEPKTSPPPAPAAPPEPAPAPGTPNAMPPGSPPVAAASASSVAANSGESDSDPISGKWQGRIRSDQFRGPRARFQLELKLSENNDVTGGYSSANTSGEVESGHYDTATKQLTLSIKTSRSTITLTAKREDGKLTGNLEVGRDAGSSLKAEFEATRGGEDDSPRDGREWKPIGQWLPAPRWVSSIESSRHQTRRVYMTLDGHRQNDDEPYLFVSENHGRTWRPLRANLPTTAGTTHTLREDLVNPDVLYLGCEFSTWVSIDRGDSWTKLNANLPTVAVHELALHPTSGEIVAATHGRSIWILDITPVRQMSADAVREDAELFQPNTVIRWRSEPTRGSSGTRRFVGQNPASGAEIFYSLGKDAGEVILRISTVEGRELAQLVSSVGGGREPPEPNRRGLHKIRWDLRRSSGQNRGQSVGLGVYLITLVVDGKEHKRTLRVEGDPNHPTTDLTTSELEWQEAELGVRARDK